MKQSHRKLFLGKRLNMTQNHYLKVTDFQRMSGGKLRGKSGHEGGEEG